MGQVIIQYSIGSSNQLIQDWVKQRRTYRKKVLLLTDAKALPRATPVSCDGGGAPLTGGEEAENVEVVGGRKVDMGGNPDANMASCWLGETG